MRDKQELQSSTVLLLDIAVATTVIAKGKPSHSSVIFLAQSLNSSGTWFPLKAILWNNAHPSSLDKGSTFMDTFPSSNARSLLRVEKSTLLTLSVLTNATPNSWKSSAVHMSSSINRNFLFFRVADNFIFRFSISEVLERSKLITSAIQHCNYEIW